MGCDAWIEWSDGERYRCTRDDVHNGMYQMHAAMIRGEYTNWDDTWKYAGRGAKC